MTTVAARQQAKGFALAEALVAIAILAVMLAVSFDSYSASAQIERMAALRRQAVMLAQSILDQASSTAAGSQAGSGEQGRLAWAVADQPFSANARDNDPPLEQVSVVVRDMASGRPLVHLATLRLAR